VTDAHACPLVTPSTPPVPHVGGPITGPGEPTVLIGFLPAGRVGDRAVCIGPANAIVQGSSTVLIGSLPAARLGDALLHGGAIVIGCPTVLIGDDGQGATLMKAGACAAPLVKVCGKPNAPLMV
jgi:uncharacterized Zn-binding protein involved in type VI secretion